MADVFMNIVIDEKLKRKLEGIADREQRSLSGQVRTIVEQWLEKQED